MSRKPQFKVLVAEDDKFLRDVLKMKLGAEGFSVVAAEDGQQTMSALAASRPDIVLLDLMMPKKSGFDVLEDMRLKGEWNVPVVILSNLGQEDDIKRGLDLGASDFLVKSEHSLKEVVDKVKNCVVQSRS